MRAIATKKQPVYTASGALESGRYIDKNDRCEVGSITQNLLIPITYPAGGGTRQAYVRSLEGFIQGYSTISGTTPISNTPASNIPALLSQHRAAGRCVPPSSSKR